jgi:CO/xanthine dehydrogenase Mo-binding subunit/aerobic-type carbon monoxide dehydrogenase small subunit (CoxS/CutS family)
MTSAKADRGTTKTEFPLTVNDAEFTVTCEPNTPLLDVLRHDLGLAGPKFGCGMGLCGACFVLINGRARASCDLPVAAVMGPVTTVEGLTGDDGLDPVQQAFIDEQAAQCGYCTSGMVMAAVGLLRERPAPTEAEVRGALDGNLCRCGTYDRIVRAVLSAAARGSGGQAVPARPPAWEVLPTRVPAVGTQSVEGPVLAPPSGSSSPVVAESGVSSTASSLPADLAANPVLGRWLDFSRDGEVTIRTGKVEYGQGIWTALAQVAAEELQVGLARVRVAPVSTGTSPNEGITAGSLSVQDSGSALRQACAQARDLVLDAAASRLGVARAALDVTDGEIRTGDGPTGLSYWTVLQQGMLDRPADASAPPRPAAEWSVAGRSAPRLDIPDKVTGRHRFLHDIVLPGMAYGRVVRPPARASELTKLAGVDLGREIVLVRDGSFLGVVAPTDRDARVAAGQVAREARWRTTPSLPDERDLRGFLLSAPAQEETVVDQTDGDAAATATRTLTAEFTRPFLAHASVAPSCAIARWDGGSVTVWCHSQGIFILRDAIAAGLELDASQVAVRYVEGAGVYGQNGADDVAMDAVLLARAVPGQAVRVEWSREDEMCWSPLGSAMLSRLSAGLDAAGGIVTWRQDVWSNGFMGRPTLGGEPRLLALTQLAGGQPMSPSPDLAPANWMGASRNSVPGYDIADVHVYRHRLLEMPIRTSSLRSLGAHLNVFAIESFMDELAAATGADPVRFRLGHLADPRARQVLTEAAGMAGWDTRGRRDGIGYGVGVARYSGVSGYCAAVAEVEAGTDIRVRSLWLAVDVGRVINPDGVVNQVEGGAVQSASWTLREQVRFDRDRITSATWDTYPIIRFMDAPEVMVRVMNAPGEPEVGAGEVAQGPVAGAIGNAVADATGVRVRDLPLTDQRVAEAKDENPRSGRIGVS